MIEKIKRRKQIDNQDKQQPQTIQDLIRRYDLDNIEVKDYLDYLIGRLKEIQEGTEEDIDGLPIAKYKSDGTNFDDPDTTTHDLILTNVNTPENGAYYYIKTFFYKEKSATSNRAQIAIGYIKNTLRQRYYRNGAWSEWGIVSQPIITTGTEFKTGRIIDGKEEYGKRIELGELPNNTNKIVETELNMNIVNIESLSGAAIRDTAKLPLPYVSNTAPISMFIAENGKLQITTTSDRSTYTGHAYVYYTKNS